MTVRFEIVAAGPGFARVGRLAERLQSLQGSGQVLLLPRVGLPLGRS